MLAFGMIGPRAAVTGVLVIAAGLTLLGQKPAANRASRATTFPAKGTKVPLPPGQAF